MAASTVSSSAPSAGLRSDAGPPAVVGSSRSHARPNAWLAAVGIWAVLGLVSLAPRAGTELFAFGPRLVYHLVHILTLGALTGSVVWVSRRTESWLAWSRFGLHIALAAAFAALVTFIATAALRSAPNAAPIRPLAIFELHFLAYFAVLAITYALDFLAWRRDQRVEEARLAERSARLEAQLARTELQILVARLGDLLRMSAALARAGDVPLRDELAFVNAYLEIQQARFGSRLRIVRNVDATTLDAAVPSLLVQPLVENAIRHGTSKRATGGQLEIVTRRMGSSLVIEVLDDGPGLPTDQTPDEGIGIGHTRARLAQLYGGRGALELESRPGGGTRARVRLPYARATPRAPHNGAADRVGEP